MTTEPTDMNPVPEWARTLLGVLDEQDALVSELAGLAQQQTELIRAARTDALLELLTRRQDIIQRFTSSQQHLGQLTEHVESRLDDADPATRQTIEHRIAAIGSRLSEVMAQDAADQQALEEARGRARQELGTFDAARQARQAYLGAGLVSNRFADQRG